MESKDFKEPYNALYLLGFVAALLIPTLPASLTWLQIVAGH